MAGCRGRTPTSSRGGPRRGQGTGDGRIALLGHRGSPSATTRRRVGVDRLVDRGQIARKVELGARNRDRRRRRCRTGRTGTTTRSCRRGPSFSIFRQVREHLVTSPDRSLNVSGQRVEARDRPWIDGLVGTSRSAVALVSSERDCTTGRSHRDRRTGRSRDVRCSRSAGPPARPRLFTVSRTRLRLVHQVTDTWSLSAIVFVSDPCSPRAPRWWPPSPWNTWMI